MTVFFGLGIKQHLSDVFHVVSHHAKANLRRCARVLVKDDGEGVHVLTVKGQHVIHVQLLLAVKQGLHCTGKLGERVSQRNRRRVVAVVDRDGQPRRDVRPVNASQLGRHAVVELLGGITEVVFERHTNDGARGWVVELAQQMVGVGPFLHFRWQVASVGSQLFKVVDAGAPLATVHLGGDFGAKRQTGSRLRQTKAVLPDGDGATVMGDFSTESQDVLNGVHHLAAGDGFGNPDTVVGDEQRGLSCSPFGEEGQLNLGCTSVHGVVHQFGDALFERDADVAKRLERPS